jgi:nitroreductase
VSFASIPVAIRQIVEAGHSAPTGENCQPFRFVWDGRALAITRDAARARHRLDVGDHASLIALGCVWEAMDLAASALDLGLVATLGGAQASPSAPWLTLTPTPAKRTPDPLRLALSIRVTDRREFRGGTLDAARDALDAGGVSRGHDPTLRLQSPSTPALCDYILASDGLLWRDPATVRDALRWVRYTDAEVRRTRDGLSWRNLGYPAVASLGSRLVRSLPPLLALGRLGGGPLETRRLLSRQLASSAAIGCVAVTAPGRGPLVATGRLAMRAWLAFARAGLGFQPLSLPSLCAYNRHTGVLPRDLDAGLRDHFARGPRVLGGAFDLPEGSLPVWMFRVGAADPLPHAARSLRLPLEDVLSAAEID